MKSGTALIRAQFFLELRNTLRNGEQLLLLVIIPLGVWFIGNRVQPDTAFTYALVTGLLAANFTSVAISTGFERRWGVLRSYATSPLALSHVVTAKAIGALTVSLTQFIVLSTLARSFSGVALLAVLAANAALAPWALLMGTTLKAERVLALANLAFIVLVAGLWLEHPAMTLIPSGAIKAIASGHGVVGLPLVLLWSLVGSLLTIRRGRWTE